MPGAPFTHDEYVARLERVQRGMADERLDAVILTEHANFEWLTGYVVNVLWSSFTRILAVAVPRTGAPILLTPDFVAESAHAASEWPVETYSSLAEPPLRELVYVIERAMDSPGQPRHGRIGVEWGGESRLGMTVSLLEALRGRLGSTGLADAGPLMHRARMVKSVPEVDRLRWACAANAAGMAAVFGRPRLGEREVDIARELLLEGLRAGSGWPAWTVPGWIGMTSGPGSYARFVEQPRDRRLERGDMLWTDVGFRVDGYWSDYCRAGVVGGPTAQQRDRQARILEATDAGIAACRPGATASDVARAVGEALERLGLPGLGFGRVGHGIGISATEPPSVALHDTTRLEAGMVITIEPAAVHDDGMYCAEQIVVVGEPPEVLSLAPTELAAI